MGLTNGNDCIDCGPDTELSVKQRLAQGTPYSQHFDQILSPVAEEIKDLETAGLAYSTYPIIPFLDGGDATLSFFRKLRELSATHGSCIENKKKYCIGGEFTVYERKRTGFRAYNKIDIANEQSFNEVIDFIESANPLMDGDFLLDQIAAGIDNEETFGNFFYKMTFMPATGGGYLGYFECIDAEKCRYHNPVASDSLFDTILISDSWKTAYVEKYPPEFVSVYPGFSEDEETGIITSIYHWKNNVPGRDWYGMPASAQALYYMFLEMQLGHYGTDGYANAWTPRAFIETASTLTQDSAAMSSFFSNLIGMFTNKGKRRRIIHRNRTPDEPASVIHEFKDDKSHEFHQGMAEMAESQIIKAHNWHTLLMGRASRGRLSSTGDEFREAYRSKNQTEIKPKQKRHASAVNLFLRKLGELNNTSVMENYSIALDDLFREMEEEEVTIENVEEAAQTSIQRTTEPQEDD